jgi:LysM repeat protein
MIKFLVVLGLSFFNSPQDSIGLETVNGKTFIVHKVVQGETLYGISKRYGVTVDQILEYNVNADAGLEIDQILKVPYVPRPVRKIVNGETHRVAEKETLFSISRMYGVTIDELKTWNNLTDSNLALGQELIVNKKGPVPVAVEPIKSKSTVHTVAMGETLFSISRQYNLTVEQLKKWNNLSGNTLDIGQTLYVTQPIYGQDEKTQQVTTITISPEQQTTTPTAATQVQPVTVQPVTSSTIRISESVRGSDEVVESGLAELIEGTEGNRKYLALHRSAPVGTILKIRNQMNNREVFVRVIGKLPDTALTNKLVIKISKSAYDRLGAIDPRFLVEVTYYK